MSDNRLPRYIALQLCIGKWEHYETDNFPDIIGDFWNALESNDFAPVAVYDRYSGSLFAETNWKHKTIDEWQKFIESGFSLNLPIARLIPIDWNDAWSNICE